MAVPSVGSIIIPSDILAAVAADEAISGWLGGARLNSERVFVTVSAQIGSETRYCGYTERLAPHHAFNPLERGYEERLVRWVKTSADFPAGEWIPAPELAGGLTLDLADLREEGPCVCIVSTDSDSPRARGFAILSRDGKSKLLPLQTILMPVVQDPLAKLPAELAAALSGKTVILVGLGSGGGEIASNLACAGVGKLVLFDDDRLLAENYVRHILTGRDLGRGKVLGVRDNLHERGLSTKVVTFTKNIVSYADDFRNAIVEHRPDLIICATDSVNSRRLMNVCAIKLGVPLTVAGILDAGRIGEVVLVKPGKSACYECIRTRLATSLEVADSPERSLSPYAEDGDPNLASAAQRFDVGFVASLATRASLSVLDPKTYPELPADYVIWGREATCEYDAPFQFQYPLTVNYVPVSMQPDCPVCGTLPKELEGIDIDATAAEIIAQLGPISE